MTEPTQPEAAAVALLRHRVAEFLGPAADELTPSANLVLLGLTSLNVMRLNTQLRRAGAAVDFDDMIANPTLEEWIRLVEKASAQAAQP